MNRLIYGNGNCSISSNVDIRGIEIRYKGVISITDKTPEGFNIIISNNKIIIFPLGQGNLTELFDYQGEFRVISVLVADKDAKQVPTSIKRVMDYAELLDTKAEDMTTNSEKLNATYRYANKVKKTSIDAKIMPNLNTNNYTLTLFREDGSEYTGKFHIHKADNKVMSGEKHSEASEELFYKKQGSEELSNIKVRQEPARTTARTATSVSTTSKTTSGGY